jgi:large subunit ribosomal protein L1
MGSKRLKKAFEMFDRQKKYKIDEAIKLLQSIPKTKFDETVEIHMKLGVDPRKAEQQIRNSLVLPHGTGKTIKTLVFSEGEKADDAKKAGADYVGLDEYIEKIKSGWLDFDVVISTPNLMGKIGKLGKILGPRGLMPNPKTGTVTMDIEKAVKDSKGGKITYRVDKLSNLHIIAGKLSFNEDNLKENILTIIRAILRERPAALKGIFIQSITLTSTMGPGLKLDVATVALESKK